MLCGLNLCRGLKGYDMQRCVDEEKRRELVGEEVRKGRGTDSRSSFPSLSLLCEGLG